MAKRIKNIGAWSFSHFHFTILFISSVLNQDNSAFGRVLGERWRVYLFHGFGNMSLVTETMMLPYSREYQRTTQPFWIGSRGTVNLKQKLIYKLIGFCLRQ
jgi:hypothetical protein